ncbi:MAG: alpha/beta hydrolase family protein [Gammaproteobacteria bacterium]|nr:alpha/beta hydrolase family protein [Gammaproteobacteria bacterium]MBU1731944.1 alpha/beta hydrolase family protein [Gammaproteobacteria bacterium]MBU1893082.1 alpha/beta hydrolase family protein [Gammaproteobacteria bacterium]
MLKFIVALYLTFFTLSAPAADLAREKRLADEIVDMIIEGEPVWLNASNHSFLSIFTPTTQRHPRGAAIILHGRGMHPDWADVVAPLRTGLPASGWHTLSLQMPVLEKDVKYNDYVPLFAEAGPRIDAAIAYLRDTGVKHIVLAAHSCGAHMAMHWVARQGDKDINAYIGIGMGATDFGQPMIEPFPLAKMHVPVLDVYGSAEYPQVLNMAPERLAAMRKAGNPQSRQIVVPGADHYFHERNGELVKVVTEWLDQLKL